MRAATLTHLGRSNPQPKAALRGLLKPTKYSRYVKPHASHMALADPGALEKIKVAPAHCPSGVVDEA